MKVEWWWLVVVALIVWCWRGQRDELAFVKSTPGYKAALATTGHDPLKKAPPGGVSVVTNPQGTSAFTD
jgi:hypothetical protein